MTWPDRLCECAHVLLAGISYAQFICGGLGISIYMLVHSDDSSVATRGLFVVLLVMGLYMYAMVVKLSLSGRLAGVLLSENVALDELAHFLQRRLEAAPSIKFYLQDGVSIGRRSVYVCL